MRWRMDAGDPEATRLGLAALNALARGDRANARSLAAAALIKGSGEANARQVLGILALEAGDAAQALIHLDAANRAAPNQPAILNSLGLAQRRTGRIDEARTTLRRAGELGVDGAWRNLGALESEAGDVAAALLAYEAALRQKPDDISAMASLARVWEQRHDLQRARSFAERALSLAPANTIAQLALASVLLREGDLEGAIRAAEIVISDARARPANKTIAWGVIGDARDRSGDAVGAFQAFSEANALQAQIHGAWFSATQSPYHPASVQRMIAFAETAGAAPPASSFSTKAPVFLIGFPRSGTTLLDQILASHSAVVCLEEKDIFAATMETAAGADWDLSVFAQPAPGLIETLRSDYWRRARALVGSDIGERTFVDKLPLNLVLLPLIDRVFPHAKIIFALRDPRDAILSCFQQRFGMNAAMAQFLGLETAVAYYDLAMRLYDVCCDRLGVAPFVVRYEEVVADLKGQARALAAFLGLPFEQAMLDYRRTAQQRSIATPSARQVTQPLYATSIGRWRRYADRLAPVLPALSPWVRRFGYAD